MSPGMALWLDLLIISRPSVIVMSVFLSAMMAVWWRFETLDLIGSCQARRDQWTGGFSVDSQQLWTWSTRALKTTTSPWQPLAVTTSGCMNCVTGIWWVGVSGILFFNVIICLQRFHFHGYVFVLYLITHNERDLDWCNSGQYSNG